MALFAIYKTIIIFCVANNDIAADRLMKMMTMVLFPLPLAAKPYTAKPYTENPTQSNTNKSNTKEIKDQSINHSYIMVFIPWELGTKNSARKEMAHSKMLGANEDTHPAIYLSKHGLSDLQKKCVEMEASGEYTRKQMAEKFGVHRNTIRRWLEQPSSKKYLETLQNEHRQQALSQINTAVPIATKKLIELINDTDKRVALEAVKAVLDRALGKPTAKVEIETEIQNTLLEINIEDEIKRIMSGDTAIPQDAIEVDFTEVTEVE